MCFLGCFLTSLFYIFVKEPQPEPRPNIPTASVRTIYTAEMDDNAQVSFENFPGDAENGKSTLLGPKSGKKNWMSWFESASFWKITAIYTFARMFVNVSQVYIPLYLQYYLRLPKETISIIPLVINLASFGFSFMANFLSRHYGSRVSLRKERHF